MHLFLWVLAPHGDLDDDDEVLVFYNLLNWGIHQFYSIGIHNYNSIQGFNWPGQMELLRCVVWSKRKRVHGRKWNDCLLWVLLVNTIYIVSFYTYQIGHVYSSFCCCIVSQKLQEVYYLRPSSPCNQISWYSNKSATLLGADLIYNLINRFLIAWHFHGGKTPLIRIDYSLDWTTAAVAAKKCISMWSIGFSFLAGSNFFSMHTQSIISSSP